MKPRKKRRAKTFCERFPEKCESLAKELGSDPEATEEAIAHYFASIERSMRNPTMPSIYLSKFAWLRPHKGKIRRAIKAMFRSYHLGKLDEDVLRERLKILWPILKRLQVEDMSHDNRGVKLGREAFYRWRELFMDHEGEKLDPRGHRYKT